MSMIPRFLDSPAAVPSADRRYKNLAGARPGGMFWTETLVRCGGFKDKVFSQPRADNLKPNWQAVFSPTTRNRYSGQAHDAQGVRCKEDLVKPPERLAAVIHGIG